ncbi:uncharacterized protein LOC120688303 isoform X2 [Panicum virgatum]|uniref:Uncharacterized protein n=1 Tax=Panicum virgatum TaxID=38727 RepID=A0A8T0MI45_PANVG|nr:uncharacterized protein LOC120688303 isoform X2 [Panicum virgatum]KAG2536438.1 hypothetical protein PVAP13_9NG188800 [Panicum virgatum]
MLMARLAKGPFLKRQLARPTSRPKQTPPRKFFSAPSPPIYILSRRPRFVAPTVLTPTASGRFNAAPQFPNPHPKRSPPHRNPSPSRRGCRRTAAAAAEEEECRDEVGLEERLIEEDREIWEKKSTALLYGLVLTHHAPSSVEPPLRADPQRASTTRRLTRSATTTSTLTSGDPATRPGMRDESEASSHLSRRFP